MDQDTDPAQRKPPDLTGMLSKAVEKIKNQLFLFVIVVVGLLAILAGNIKDNPLLVYALLTIIVLSILVYFALESAQLRARQAARRIVEPGPQAAGQILSAPPREPVSKRPSWSSVFSLLLIFLSVMLGLQGETLTLDIATGALGWLVISLLLGVWGVVSSRGRPGKLTGEWMG